MADKKPMSEARKAANKKWNDENLKVKYDRIQLVVPKGDKDIIKAAADKAGESLNAFICNAVRMRMDSLAVTDSSTGDSLTSMGGGSGSQGKNANEM